MDNLVQVIQSLGFPVACVVALFWLIVRITDQHREEMKELTSAVNNNTQALVRLEEKIGGMKS